MPEYLYFPLALALTVLFIKVFSPVAKKIGLVDQPGGRKTHKGAVPLVGGISLFLTFFLLMLTIDVPLGSWRSLFFAAALMFITGILDDFHETPAAVRFVAQIVAILIVIFWGKTELLNLGALFGGADIVLVLLALPLTLLGGVGVMNAVNMIDGLDGLAGGMLLIFFGCLWYLASAAGLEVDAAVLGILCFSLVGFLFFNMSFSEKRTASVFLGDSGTLFLGLLAAWFLIRLTQAPYDLLRPITAVWLLALPIMDTVAIMARRIMQGRSPFSPDREHFHHILLVAGFNIRSTVGIILLLNALLAALGLLSEWMQVPEYIMFYSFLVLFALYFWGMNHAWKVMKALRKVHDYGLGVVTPQDETHV